jgi:hypothetical protein
MASFGKRIDVPGGRRRIKRRPVHIRGSATSMGRSRSVIIQDMCLIGAKLFGRDLPQPGAEIVLRTGDRAIQGRVAWADDDHRGIIFGVLPKAA